MAYPPCNKCPDRHAGCHAECEKYAAFAKEREAERQIEFQKRSVEARLDGYAIEQAIKSRKRKKWRKL